MKRVLQVISLVFVSVGAITALALAWAHSAEVGAYVTACIGAFLYFATLFPLWNDD